MKYILKILGFINWLIVGPTRDLWPDWRCTETVTRVTKPSRKREKWRGTMVTPQERYLRPLPLHTRTDGKQWLVRCNSNYISHQVNAVMWLLFGALWFFIFYDFHMGIALLPLIPALYYNYRARAGGEDTWIVFDRTTGNVCFWKRDAKHSLTVPFEKVNCYWIELFRRGVSHSLYFMPTENLPNERHRWWQAMFGAATRYDEAQYLWRVMTDFMDQSKPIPAVPGLSHQLYFVEKHGYTIKDLTEGEKEITLEDFEEAEDEFKRITSDLDEEFGRMLEPECFDVDTIIAFYNSVPRYAQQSLLSTAAARLEIYVIGLESENPYMCPLFPESKKLFTFDEYKTRVEALADYFFKIHKELNPPYSYVDRSD